MQPRHSTAPPGLDRERLLTVAADERPELALQQIAPVLRPRGLDLAQILAQEPMRDQDADHRADDRAHKAGDETERYAAHGMAAAHKRHTAAMTSPTSVRSTKVSGRMRSPSRWTRYAIGVGV